MQGMPKNLLTPSTASAVKTPVDANSQVNVNGKLVSANANSKISGNVEGAVEGSESKGAFASLFSSLIGGDSAKAEGAEAKSTGIPMKVDVAMAQSSAKAPVQNLEVKLDALMGEKNQDVNKKAEVSAVTTEEALSPEVLKNVNNLLASQVTPKTNSENDQVNTKSDKSQAPVGDQVAAASSNLDQLLQSLKAQKAEDQIQKSGVQGEGQTKETEASAKSSSPLDFLLKESKASDLGKASTPASAGSVAKSESKLFETNPEGVSKLGLSSEDFISQLGSKEIKDPKFTARNADVMNLDGSKMVDPKEMVQKQMNQSMKSYGQKQELLNGNIIRSPKDLANRDSKSKVQADELKSPDMKIAAELTGLKEAMIPVMQKQEQGQQQAMTQESSKVLDLSKMNTSNTSEIIKRISDYVAQERVSNKDSLDLTVKHDSLGEFKIQVNRPVGANQQMDMQITTTTSEGHEFFTKHEIGLMKNLSQAGIQLSDLRIVSETGNTSFAGTDSRQNNNSQNGSQFAGKEFMSFEASGDSSHGADRRRELWQQARNNQQRYGA